MNTSRLWGALGGAGLLGGVAAFFALKAAAGSSSDALAPTVSVCEAPRHHDCSFYASCIESNVACGPTGYALAFGDKYCRRFQAAPLSPSGAAWADGVMLCLQKSLLPYDKPDRKSASCDEISEAAFDAHAACYTALPASICFLPPEDVVTVFDTIGADEVFAARTRAQIQAVILTCTEQVAQRAAIVATQGPDAVDALELPAKQFWRHLAVDHQVPLPRAPDVRPQEPAMSLDLWTDAFLDEMRTVGDPPADAAIAAVFSGGDVAAVNRLMDGLVRNDGVPAANLPSAVADYLAASAALPAFDPEAVAVAQDLFVRHGPEVLSTYGFYSLPAAYAAKRGVQVIHRTGYLARRPVRRAFETVQMVVDVLSPGGLAPAGRGVRTAQKVRLMHAAVRRLLTHDPARHWDAALGVPINQEDLAGTLMTFSCLVLEGLSRLGVALTTAEQEAYHHTWMGVGRVLGVREDLLPESPADARELTLRIYRRHIEGSPEGAELLAALLEGYDGLVPSGPLSGGPRSLLHHFLDEEPITGRNVSRLLGLADAGIAEEMTRAAVGVAELVGLAVDVGPSPAAMMAQQLGLVTTKAILALDRGGSRAPFHVPENLVDQWWARSQGADALPSAAQDLVAAGSQVARSLTGAAGQILTSAAVAAMPRWKTAGRWRDLLFASWSLPAEAIRPLVPAELDLDLFEDKAWVTIVPMRMENVRWQDMPAATATPTLTELNLRTYVRRGDRRGVYFLSIDVDSAWIDVAASATLDLPATLARMTFEHDGDRVRFESERIQPGAPAAHLACSYRVTGEPRAVAPGTLEAFLVERFSMFFAGKGGVVRGDIEHEPWLVAPVEAELTINTLAGAAGLALPDGAPHLLHSEGSDTVVMPLDEG